MSEYVNGVHMPESEKLLSVSKESQKIGEFLDWLEDEKGLVLASYGKGDPDQTDQNADDSLWMAGHPDRLYAEVYSKESLLAEFFEIDLNVVEKERRELLKTLGGEL